MAENERDNEESTDNDEYVPASSGLSPSATGQPQQPAATPPPKMKANKPSRSINSLIRMANAKVAGPGSGAKAGETPEDLECWLVRIDGRDFGPYDAVTVRKRLEAGEIDEHTITIDTRDNSMCELADMPHFEEGVSDYVIRRAQRRIEEQERREELIHEVKKRSVRATVSVTLASVLLAGLGLVVLHTTDVLRIEEIGETIRPTPIEFPIDQIVRSYRYRFEVSEPDYEGMELDSAFVASLFEQPRVRRSGNRQGATGAAPTAGSNAMVTGSRTYDEGRVVAVELDSDAPDSRLSQAQINQTIAANAGRIQNCFQGELQRNPAFRGVDLTFSINPDGTTFNIRVQSSGPRSSAVETCLVQAVRSTNFPSFNNLPMNVSFPFYVR